MPHYLYILKCCDGTYYTGVARDPKERERAHNTHARVGYTRQRRPVKLVYAQAHPDVASARARRRQLKRWPNAKRQALVEGRLTAAESSAPEPAVPDPDDFIRLATWRMPFGKYKGCHLIDLPEAYVVWLSRKGFPEGKLGELLACLYEVKLNGLEELLEPYRRR